MKRIDTVYEPFATDAEAIVELQVRFDRVFSKPSKLDSFTLNTAPQIRVPPGDGLLPLNHDMGRTGDRSGNGFKTKRKRKND